MSSYWGYHALIDAYKCDATTFTRENIADFLAELVPAIDMVAYGEPMIEHFATHSLEKAGYTGVQMIETSHIALHLVDSDGNGYFDVFSCKPVDVGVFQDVIMKYFRPTRTQLTFLTRNAH